MSQDLDSIVKGAASVPAHDIKNAAAEAPGLGKPTDATNNAPSSPSMVYLNLLILEASLRAQYLELRARRRHHTFFFAILALWIAFFGYQLFFAPREDGRGVGGSIYWAVEGAQKVCFMGGIITAILVWAVGIWERGIRWPRRWFAVSNRGLRPFNCKLVLIRRPWYAEALSTVGFFLTYGLFSTTSSSSYRYVEASLLRDVQKDMQLQGDTHPTLVVSHVDEERGGHEEDLSPGGDYVKLLLLAKPFSPTFRENWELYRSEYWERENERRAMLRAKVKENDRRLAKQQFGWLWWLPGRRPRSPLPSQHDKHHHHLHHQRQHQAALDKERKRRSSSVRRSSTSSSRTPTPLLEPDDLHMSRKTGSSAAAGAADKRRRKGGSVSSRAKKAGTESRSVTPDIPSPLAMESSAVDDEPDTPASGRVLRSSRSKTDDK